MKPETPSASKTYTQPSSHMDDDEDEYDAYNLSEFSAADFSYIDSIVRQHEYDATTQGTGMPLQSRFSGQDFEKWLGELGKGSFNDEHNNVILPQALRCSTNNIGDLIDFAYPSIHVVQSDEYFRQHCILAPRESEVHEINKIALDRFPGALHGAWSVNKAIDARTQSPNDDFPVELLDSISPSNFPLAQLSLKVGCPVIFLRNIGRIPAGCRGIVTKISTRVLEVRILSGQVSGQVVFVPRFPLTITDRDLPFELHRTQCPLALAFAMTIDKAQGQTFSRAVGIDLRFPCFAHGQLYLALSRAQSPAGIKCIVGTNARESKTKNII